MKLPAFSSHVTDGTYCHVRVLSRNSAGPMVAVAGDERCLPPYHVSRTTFACWGLEYVAEGEGSLILGKRSHRLNAGAAFIYGPNIPHEIRTIASRPLRKYFVDFFGRDARSFMHKIDLVPGELQQVQDLLGVHSLFDALIKEGQKSQRNSAETADAYLRLLLLKIAEAPAQNAPSISQAYQTWHRCQTLLDDSSHNIKGLRELSRLARVNPSHLCRLFKRFGNSSPLVAITNRKMNRAASLLLTRSQLIKDIAAQVGYDDPLHFSRAFRRQFGVSPQSFRTKNARLH